METLVYEVLGKKVEVPVIRKSIKNAYLKVKDDQVIMTANKWMSLKELQKFGEFHIEKIILKMEKADIEYMYREHEYIYIFGNKLKIEYDDLNSIMSGILMNEDKVIINSSLKPFATKALLNFMQKEVDTYISVALRQWEKEMKLPRHNYEINKLQSCYGRNFIGRLLLNFSHILGHYSKNFIDATIVHELAHTVIHPIVGRDDKVHSHHREFWELVYKYIPDYRVIKKKMRFLWCNLSAKALTPKELKMLNENLLKD